MTLNVILVVVGLIVVARFARYWLFLRPTELTFPLELTERVESEEFREWLSRPDEFLIWERDFEGRYHVVAQGWLRARAIRNKAMERPRETTQTP